MIMSLKKAPPKTGIAVDTITEIAAQLHRLNNIVHEIVKWNEDMDDVYHRFHFHNHRHVLRMSKELFRLGQANREVFGSCEENIAEIVTGSDPLKSMQDRNNMVIGLIKNKKYAEHDIYIAGDIDLYIGRMAPTVWISNMAKWKKILVRFERSVKNLDHKSELIKEWKNPYVEQVKLIEHHIGLILDVIMPGMENESPGTMGSEFDKTSK